MFTPDKSLNSRFEEALAKIAGSTPARLADLRGSSLFFLVHHLAEPTPDTVGPAPPLLVITETTNQAIRYKQFLVDVTRLVADREPKADEYLVFPSLEPQNLFEYADLALDVVEARNKALSGLQDGNLRVLFSSYKACWRLLPDPDEFSGRQLLLGVAGAKEAGDGLVTSIERSELASTLDDFGYSPVKTVTAVGEYAVRGGLVDVFPAGADRPVRIDLFGNEIDRLLVIDPETQRSGEALTTLRIPGIKSSRELMALPEVCGWFHDHWAAYEKEHARNLSRSAFARLRDVVHSDLEALAQGTETLRLGWYSRSMASREHCLWHYLPEGTQVVAHEDGFINSETNSYFRFWENRFDDWLKNGLSFLGLSAYYYQPKYAISATAERLSAGSCTVKGANGEQTLDTPQLKFLLTHSFSTPESDPLPSASVGLETPPASARWGTSKIVQTVTDLPKASTDSLAAHDTSGGAFVRPYNRALSILTQFSARMREIMGDAGLQPEVQNAILPGGFVVPKGDAGQPPWTVITDMEIFGEIAEISPTPAKKYRREAIRRTDELNPGDFVIHIDYGVARFAQLADRKVFGITKSFVELEFAGRDRLFVPVDQLDRLRKYSFDGTVPTLNNLGRDTWSKTKQKIQRDTLELAKKLLSLYKSRMQKPGISFGPATVWQEEFADGFPYRLTEDQVVAWREVESDMENEKAMDRLLCGDVGFGKTEVAMRAAFKACIEERQVLVLCPTTILADQHFRTFGRRFSPFPFKVAVLSRFQSAKKQKEIVKELVAGKVDVVIATHRGLSKDVEFKQLGLLVIDEEQRFGVKQKERLKMRFPKVDVLAMTATPIPRTLHMSLIGLRDISLIETAPVARKPVKTYVGEYDKLLVREAILRELGRGGQIYYLHNKVQDIDTVKASLELMVPEVKVLVGHGQMPEARLEEVMHAFSMGAYKILLATTIIENGLDIPTVNTIIVDRAENLGLAQMHQLRGRVGRSNVQAYSYFFHSPNRMLTEESQNRLHAIYNYAYLGAGYEIAQSDLRIRGAGNLLGAAQSGLAKQVGFEYYCELLARSISDVKALDEADIEEWDDQPILAERPGTQLDLPLEAYIPEDYVSDPVLRLELLREIASIGTVEGADEFSVSLADRFGAVPTEVENLLVVSKAKTLATALGVERLNYNRLKKHFNLHFFEGEGSWQKKAGLLDSRFSTSHGNVLEFALPFDDDDAPVELLEALESLAQLKD